jgi:hypothetical protein
MKLQCKVLELHGEWQEVAGQDEPTFVDKIILQGQDGLAKITLIVIVPRGEDFQEGNLPKHNNMLEVSVNMTPVPAEEPYDPDAGTDDTADVNAAISKWDAFRFPHLQRAEASQSQA